MGVDNFEQCGKGRPDDVAPEPGVLAFLQEAATVVGSMVDSRAKVRALGGEGEVHVMNWRVCVGARWVCLCCYACAFVRMCVLLV